MDIQQENDSRQGKFSIYEGENKAGEIYYTWSDPKILTIEHTEVNEQFRGQGVGQQLLKAVVDFARNQKALIIPVCSYAKSMFDRDPSIQDVLK